MHNILSEYKIARAFRFSGKSKEAYNMYLSMLDTVCAHAGIIDNDFNLDVKIWPNLLMMRYLLTEPI